MILDIIIPQYKEKEDEIKILLDSIMNQKDVDFNNIYITIVNDKSDTLLSDEFINKYDKLHAKYLINDKNTGPGLARQKGIDNTLGDYITFIDSDDYLVNDYVLSKVIKFIDKNNPKYIVTNIITKTLINDKLVNISKKGNETMPWMHGKFYLRKHLEDNNIRFHDSIRELEDSYFTHCVIGTLKKEEIIFLDLDTVFWTINEKSITRKKRQYPYIIDIFDEFFITAEYIYDYLYKHKSYLRYTFFINSLVARYIILNSNLFDYEELQEKKNNYMNKLYEIIKTKRNIFRFFTKEQLLLLYKNEERTISLRNNIIRIDVDFNTFYAKVIEKNII